MAIATDPNKPKKALPYADPNNPYQALPIVQQPQPRQTPPPPSYVPEQQSPLTGIQQQATTTSQALSPLVTQQATELLRNPTQGMNQNYVNQQVEALRRQNQQQYETARQGMAPMAGSAEAQRDLLRTAMTNIETESKYKSDLDQQMALLRQQALQNALSTGQGVLSANVQNLLQTQQVDMNKIERTYNMLLDEDPTAAFQYLQSQLGGMGAAGIQMQPKTAEQKAREASGAEYNTAKFTWAQYNQDNPIYVNPQTMELTPAGLAEFNRQNMSAMTGQTTASYQNLITGQANISQLRGGASADSPNHNAYMEVASKAQSYTPQLSATGTNKTNNKTMYQFTTPPPAVNSIINVGGKVYQVTSGVQTKYLDRIQREFITAIDVNSGQPVEISG